MRANILPAEILRLYTWNLLSNNTALSTITVPTDTGTVDLIPIVPINDEPKLRDSGKTYLIYGFIEQEPRMSLHHRGSISYRIVAPKFANLTEIISVLVSGFEIEDQAAANINLWTSSSINNGLFIGVRFTSCCVTYVEAADAQDAEGGPIEGLVNIRFDYVADKPVKTFAPNGTWV
jgi:hypothetical protein